MELEYHYDSCDSMTSISSAHSIPQAGAKMHNVNRNRGENDADGKWDGDVRVNPAIIHSFPIPPNSNNSNTSPFPHPNSPPFPNPIGVTSTPAPSRSQPKFQAQAQAFYAASNQNIARLPTTNLGLTLFPDEAEAADEGRGDRRGSAVMAARKRRPLPTPPVPAPYPTLISGVAREAGKGEKEAQKGRETKLEKPELELGEMDTSPFSESFSGMFLDGEYNHVVAAERDSDLEEGSQRSFVVKRYTDPKLIDPSCVDGDIDEIVVISPKPGTSRAVKKRSSTLSNLNSKLDAITEYPPGVSHSKFRSYDEDIKLTDFEFLPNTPSRSRSRSQRPAPTSSSSTRHLCAYRKPDRRAAAVLEPNGLYVVKRRKHTPLRNGGVGLDSGGAAWRELDVMRVLADANVSGTGADGGGGTTFVDKMYGTFVDAESLYIVLGHYERGDLTELVSNYGPLCPATVQVYASELLLAIQSIHSMRITHTAIRPENVYIDANWHIVLAGFEVADLRGEKCIHSSDNAYGDFKPYLAPECLLGWAHDEGVDVWGYGMVLCWMVIGRHAFLGSVHDDSTREAEYQSRIIYGPAHLNDIGEAYGAAKDLILKCLEKNPVVRIKMNDIKEHGYFSGVDWNKIAGKLVTIPSPKDQMMKRAPSSRMHNDDQQVPSENVAAPLPLAPPQKTHEVSEIAATRSSTRPITNESGSDAPRLIVEEPCGLVASTTPTEVPDVSPPSYTLDIGGAEITRDEYLQEIDTAKELTPQERMALFWEKIDSEEVMSQMHNSNRITKAKPSSAESSPRRRKLRKKKSAIKTLTHRLSTISLNMNGPSTPHKLRKKDPRRISTPPTRPRHTEQQVEPPARVGGVSTTHQTSDVFTPKKIQNLPKGVEQIGSGIGFTYSIPAASKSKASICTDKSAPRWTRHMKIFPSGLGRGIQVVRRRLSMGRLTSRGGDADAQRIRAHGVQHDTDEGVHDDDDAAYDYNYGLGIAVDDSAVGYHTSPATDDDGPLTPDTLVFGDEHVSSPALGLGAGKADLNLNADCDSIEEDLRHMSTLRLVQKSGPSRLDA